MRSGLEAIDGFPGSLVLYQGWFGVLVVTTSVVLPAWWPTGSDPWSDRCYNPSQYGGMSTNDDKS